MTAEREPSGKAIAAVAFICVAVVAWTEGVGPGAIGTVFTWACLALLLLFSFGFVLFGVWVLLVLWIEHRDRIDQ